MRTSKTAKGRVKVTAGGKLKMKHSQRNHRKTHKSRKGSKQDRKSKGLVLDKATMKKAFSKLLPND